MGFPAADGPSGRGGEGGQTVALQAVAADQPADDGSGEAGSVGHPAVAAGGVGTGVDLDQDGLAIRSDEVAQVGEGGHGVGAVLEHTDGGGGGEGRRREGGLFQAGPDQGQTRMAATGQGQGRGGRVEADAGAIRAGGEDLGEEVAGSAAHIQDARSAG